MAAYPQLPDNAPFTAAQKSWLNGWIAGVLASQADSGAGAAAAPALPLTILCGSQTGSAEGLVKRLAREAQACGFAPRVLGMDEYAKADLDACERLLVITSTYGEGEPPDNATAFWQWLRADAAPRLDALHFSVLALGDTNYEHFCQFGKLVDARLEALGAKRVLARVDCDTDYDAPFAGWMKAVLAAWRPAAGGESRLVAATAMPAAPAAAVGTKENPCVARLIDNRLLTTAEAAKETRHFALHINGLQYEVGDALGVMPKNCGALVEAVLDCGGWRADDRLRDALTHHFDLSNPSLDLLVAVAQRGKHADLIEVIKPDRGAELKAWLHGRDVLDVLALCPAGSLTPAEFTAALKKLQPRLYSIASSLKVVPNEVHLTVAQVRYQSHGRARSGVCSTFLADRLELDVPVQVYIQPSHGFRLPEDPAKPVIMVGPGTGVAPFRAFLQERQAMGGTGRNWLFFGEQSRAQSYFYKDEWKCLIRAGTLHRMDTAFSRDQEQKIYVQHRMTENGEELYRWLEDGAHFYVCGDATRMAKDVDSALHQVIQTHGGKSADQAAAYVAAMRQAKRYARDVY